MANLEIKRRVIGRGILQRYVTDVEGGDGMINTGTFTGGVANTNVGFTPKLVVAIITYSNGDQSVFLVLPDSEVEQADYNITDGLDRERRVTRQTVRDGTRRIMTLTSTGFLHNRVSAVGTGYYFAIG